jgi:hypothetical protein
MSHEIIIIESLSAQYEIPIVKKRCKVWQLIAYALLVGVAIGWWLF